MKERPSIITLGVVVLWILLFIIGCPENEPRERVGWGPRPEMERLGGSKPTKSVPKTKRSRMTFEDPWKDDARWNTIRWQDFLEDLDEEGIMLSDPDAIEIWEQDYE